MARRPHAVLGDTFGVFAEKAARFSGTPHYIVGQTGLPPQHVRRLMEHHASIPASTAPVLRGANVTRHDHQRMVLATSDGLGLG